MKRNENKEKILHFAEYACFVLLGNAITAAGAVFFLDPNGFVMGGVTGLGIFVRNLIPPTAGNEVLRSWVVNLTVYAANLVLFFLGTAFLGRKFALATLAGTLLYPAFMSLFKLANDAYLAANGNLPMGAEPNGTSVLAVICGAGLYGLGTALVMRIGASTGGTDIPPLILNKYFGISVSGSLWAIDFCIILLNFFAGASVNDILWGVVIAILTSVVLEALLPVGVKQMQVKIVSKEYEKIRGMITEKLDRGVTVLYGETGFLQEDCRMILTVVRRRELVRLKKEVQAIDPEAFLMVSVISEVHGRGFTMKKAARLKESAGLCENGQNPLQNQEKVL